MSRSFRSGSEGAWPDPAICAWPDPVTRTTRRNRCAGPMTKTMTTPIRLSGREHGPKGMSHRAQVLAGDRLVAVAEAVQPFVLEPPVRPTAAQAESARERHPLRGLRHPLSDCVVCSPERRDGLGVTPGPLESDPDILASPSDRPRGTQSTGWSARRRSGVPWTVRATRPRTCARAGSACWAASRRARSGPSR